MMTTEQKESKILKILNNRTQNSLFIDVIAKKAEINKTILIKLYDEKLLDGFLDDYFHYRMKANNYNKIGEFLSSLEAYSNLLSQKVFESITILGDDNFKNIYLDLKEKLKISIENYQRKK